MNKATGSRSARGGRGAPRPGGPGQGRPRGPKKPVEGPLARKNARVREEIAATQAAHHAARRLEKVPPKPAQPAAKDARGPSKGRPPRGEPAARKGEPQKDARPDPRRDAPREGARFDPRRDAPRRAPAPGSAPRKDDPRRGPAPAPRNDDPRRGPAPAPRNDDPRRGPQQPTNDRKATPRDDRKATPRDDRKAAPRDDRKAAPRDDRKGPPPRKGAPPPGKDASARKDAAADPTRTPRPAIEPTKAMLRDREGPVPTGPSRSGSVAIVGRSNVGKSTLLNAALEMPLAIVSPTPQTTRDSLLGVVRHGTAEVGLLDTPGIFEAETALDRAMIRAANDATADADVVVFVTAVSKTATQNDDPLRPHRRDIELLKALPASAKVVIAVNKIDLVKDKRRLLNLLTALGEARPVEAIIPISALREDGVRRVLDEVAKLLPEGEPRYAEDDVTDRPARFFAREYVREQILLATHEEVPHAVAITIDDWVEGDGKRATRVSATIHVERSGQKKILVGAGGSMLTRIGSSARARLAELVGGPVHLELFVRVTKNWRNAPTKLGDMGYGPRASDEGGSGGGVVIHAVADDGDDADGEDGNDADVDGEDADDMDGNDADADAGSHADDKDDGDEGEDGS